MIYMNELMKNVFGCESDTILDLAREIANCTRNLCDCLVYDKAGEINETKLNFDRIMMMYGDRTGYEVVCNEIRIDKLSKSQINSFFNRT